MARGFDYVGDSLKDLPVWAAARSGIVANANKVVEAAARRVTTVEGVIGNGSGQLSAYAHAMRPHQWLKNLLVFVPLFLSHRITDCPRRRCVDGVRSLWTLSRKNVFQDESASRHTESLAWCPDHVRLL